MKFSPEGIYSWYRQTIRNPKYRWWIILGSLAYLFLPFDIAPDFIPVIGQIDDLVVLTMLISEVSQMLVERVKSQNSGGDLGQTAETKTDAAGSKEPVDVKAVSVE